MPLTFSHPLLYLAALCAALTACVELTPPDFLDRPDGGSAAIAAPSDHQLTLDLPASLAPPADSRDPRAGADDRPPCGDERFPGPAFACLSRHILRDVGVAMTDAAIHTMRRVVDELARHEVPPDSEISLSDGELRVDLSWRETPEGRDFLVALADDRSGAAIGRWAWSLGRDGSASGELRMTAGLFDDRGPEALVLRFASDADGADKRIELAVTAPGPVSTDPGAPTALHLRARRSPGIWTVQYGTAHPSWLAPEIERGVATVLLVDAVAHTGDDAGAAMAAMQMIALPGDARAVPADALRESSVCRYVVPIFEDAGVIPPGQVTCGDGNPYYVYPRGPVVEGGAPPVGFEDLAARLRELAFLTGDPSSLWRVDAGL